MGNENVLERIASISTKLAKELSIAKNNELSDIEKEQATNIAKQLVLEGDTTLENKVKNLFENIVYEPIYSLKVANIIQANKAYINNGLPLPVFLHFSDIHKDVQRLRNILKFSRKVGIDGIFFTGDYVAGYGTEDILEMLSVQREYKDIPFFFCLGNHEQVNVNNNQIMYEKFLLPFTEWNNYVFPKENVGYYYSDIERFKLRIISLHQNFVCKGHTMGYGQEQIDWFINTLKSTPLGYGIILLRHSTEQLPQRTEGLDSFFANITDNIAAWIVNPITDLLIDAFVSRNTINTSVVDCKNVNSSLTLSADFSTVDNSIEFICVLDGHNHTDYVGYQPNTIRKILEMNIACAAMNNGAFYWYSYNDYKRRLNTFSEDLFNVFSINRKEKMIRIVRPGNNISFDLRERTHMSIPYA